MCAHFGAAVFVSVITVARLVAYAIDSRERWRRFLFLVFLALAVAVGWWLLADGGIQALLNDFGTAALIRPHQRFG